MTHAEKASRLARMSVMRSVSPRRQRTIEKHLDEITVQPGCTLIREDHANRYAYFVVNGRLDVNVGGETVASVGPGGMVGERTALGARRANATVVVAEPTTVLVMDHRALSALALDEPGVRIALEAVRDEREAGLTEAPGRSQVAAGSSHDGTVGGFAMPRPLPGEMWETRDAPIPTNRRSDAR